MLNRKLMSEIAEDTQRFVREAAELATAKSKLAVKKLSEHIQEKQEAELAKLQQAQALAQIRNQEETADNLRQSVSFALSQVPEHISFYGMISKHAMKIQYDGEGYYLIIPRTTLSSQMPKNFHAFNEALQNSFDSTHKDAILALETRIKNDSAQWQSQQLRFNATGIFSGKSDTEFRYNYADLYKQWMPFLYVISNIVSLPVSEGVKIHFHAFLYDSGLHPDNYFCNVNRSM